MKRLQQLLQKTFKKKSVRLFDKDFEDSQEVIDYGVIPINQLNDVIEAANEWYSAEEGSDAKQWSLADYLDTYDLVVDKRSIGGGGGGGDCYCECPDETPQYFVIGLIIGALLLYGGLRYFKK